MNKFKYEITRHPSSEFKQLVYFCTDHGECDLAQVPSDKRDILKKFSRRGEIRVGNWSSFFSALTG